MDRAITSLQNARVKNAVKLRERRARRKQGRMLIDGARELRRAIGAGVRLEDVFVCPPLCQSPDARAVLELLAATGAQVLEVTSAVFAKLAFGERVEGVLGVARTPDLTLDALSLPENPLVAVLEGVEKPGNVGAVFRSADGAGISAVIVADPRTDLFNPNAIRASLGTIFALPVCGASSVETLRWLGRQQLKIFAARDDAETAYTDVDFTRPCAIVLGSEAKGLSAAWSGEGLLPIRVPMRGVADSLNVSTAAAVLFYEALRQRTETGRCEVGSRKSEVGK